MTLIARIALLAALGSLGACATDHADDGTTIFGASFGGLLGTQIDRGPHAPFAAIGGKLARRLDGEDRERLEEAAERAYRGPLGEHFTWSNAGSGHSGSLTPVSEHRRAVGNVCREVESSITVGRDTESGFGIACQQDDGTWKVVS